MMQPISTLLDVRPNPGPAEPLLYRFEAALTVTPIGLVPEGIRMANAFEGRVTRGVLEGARVWGIDHLLLRTDGIAVIDAQKTLSGDGVHVVEHVRGYGFPPPGLHLPPLEELLDDAFVWPDVLFPVLGASTFRAAAPQLSYLNREVARIDGWFNFATGGLAIETRLLRHASRVEGPLRARTRREGADLL